MSQARNRLTDYVTALMVTIASLSYAQSPNSSVPAEQATGLIDGEVRKVDKDARQDHAASREIKQLDMPAMTMVFQVKDPPCSTRSRPATK